LLKIILNNKQWQSRDACALPASEVLMIPE